MFLIVLIVKNLYVYIFICICDESGDNVLNQNVLCRDYFIKEKKPQIAR